MVSKDQHPVPLTAATVEAFAEFARQCLAQGQDETLQLCLARFAEIRELKQEIAQLQKLPEAAAGCGFSRDEILAQYQDRLERLLG